MKSSLFLKPIGVNHARPWHSPTIYTSYLVKMSTIVVLVLGDHCGQILDILAMVHYHFALPRSPICYFSIAQSQP